MTSTTEPWRLTATQALELIRTKQLTIEAYATSLLSRISSRDELTKAWVHLPKDLILSNARALDSVPFDQRSPIHGLPCGVKDVILTKDMPTQYNSRIFESEQPIGIDAAPVMTLRAAGALIFGKLSTTEFATSKQGDWHQNRTSNAHDANRTPGGSSSGSGSAVGDFQVPIALGTQTGGSVVRPASFNGTYGFKPTWGAISREGLAQWSMTLDTCGFFARSVEDLDLIADVFRIEDDEKVSSKDFEVKSAKVAFCKTHNWHKAGAGTKKAWEDAQSILKAQGANVEDVELPDDFGHVLDWHSHVLAGEGRTSFLGQYLQAKDQLHDDIQGHVENRTALSRRKQLEAYDNCARLRPVWDQIAAQYDFVVTPSVIDEAPLGLEHTGDMVCEPCDDLHGQKLTLAPVVLFDVDDPTRTSPECDRLQGRERNACWADAGWGEIC
jgi:Asp-tRNA(Asn)/Glu-tRNA(Gln) amidotransferase A subunit family amidase